MDNKPDEIIEEQPKALIAQNLVTAKRKYFFPTTGLTLEAESTEEATAEHEKLNNEKAGDE